jgi:hypothetical protein
MKQSYVICELAAIFMLDTKTIFFFLTSMFFISCNQTSETTTQTPILADNSKVDSIRAFGDTMLIIKYKNSFDTLVNFNSLLADTKYYVEPLNSLGNKKLDFTQYEYKKMFITRITTEVNEKGFNFAGHYSFVYWGCGSACKLSAVVDIKTGKVYKGPSGGIGYSFKKDSKILIVNPPDTADFYYKDRIWQPEQYVWTNDSFVVIKNSR